MQLGRTIYYDKATGNVIVDTGEREGSVVETTFEQDFEAYAALAERVPATVGHIQLNFGQYSQDFMECNGYRVNPDTEEIEFSYPDPNEPGAPPVYRQPLSVEVDNIKQQQALMQQALDDIILFGGGF